MLLLVLSTVLCALRRLYTRNRARRPLLFSSFSYQILFLIKFFFSVKFKFCFCSGSSEILLRALYRLVTEAADVLDLELIPALEALAQSADMDGYGLRSALTLHAPDLVEELHTRKYLAGR